VGRKSCLKLPNLTHAVWRWFRTGKIIFLAPTRPLVNQQIEACQLTCGIPSADAAVMTGQQTAAKHRAKLVSSLTWISENSLPLQWEDRRVFYCTPQLLEIDLKNGLINPCDIVLVVFGAFPHQYPSSSLKQSR